MMPPVKKTEKYNNLIDLCLQLEQDPDCAGDAGKMFVKLLSIYFYKKESLASRNLELFLRDFPAPPFLKGKMTMYDIDIEELKGYIESDSLNDSLSGRIMLSQQFLKAFHSNHPPSFTKLPEDVRFEIMGEMKDRNASIIEAFEKMKKDVAADRSRKVINLVALIIKNVYRKTGRPLNKLSKPADELIGSLFKGSGDVFTGADRQMADLRDDKKINDLMKLFFSIKQYKDIAEIAGFFKEDLDRFRKRAIRARS